MRVIELKNQIKTLEADLEYQKWLEPVKAFLKATTVTAFDNVDRITRIEAGAFGGIEVTGSSYTWYDYHSVNIPADFFKVSETYIEEALAAREAKQLAAEKANRERELKLLAELKAKYESA